MTRAASTSVAPSRQMSMNLAKPPPQKRRRELWGTLLPARFAPRRSHWPPERAAVTADSTASYERRKATRASRSEQRKWRRASFGRGEAEEAHEPDRQRLFPALRDDLRLDLRSGEEREQAVPEARQEVDPVVVVRSSAFPTATPTRISNRARSACRRVSLSGRPGNLFRPYIHVIDRNREAPRLDVFDVVSARSHLALGNGGCDVDALEHHQRRVREQLQVIAHELLEQRLRPDELHADGQGGHRDLGDVHGDDLGALREAHVSEAERGVGDTRLERSLQQVRGHRTAKEPFPHARLRSVVALPQIDTEGAHRLELHRVLLFQAPGCVRSPTERHTSEAEAMPTSA